jgi:predicted TIM-barrel fold metal-dependent hydrolase
MARIAAIDADGHVQEPADAWQRHLDPAWRAYAPRALRDEQGRLRQMVGGELRPYIPTPASGDWDIPTGGHDPKQRLADMDRQGVERSILSDLRPDVAALERGDVQAALCRAYNDWLREFCGADPHRPLGIAVVPQSDWGRAREARRACASSASAA